MRKKTTFFLISLSILLFSTLLQTPLIPIAQSKPATWHVPGDFSTIQEAINAASPNDTIIVAPGVYYEHLSIFKSNLTIIGENPATTIIDGNQTASVIFLEAKNVTITGFTIQNAIYGINMIQSKNCTISNNAVNSSTENALFLASAIRMSESSNNTITKNTLTSNNGYGIRHMFNSNKNVIINNTAAGNKYGISIESSMYTTLENNNLTSNTYNFGVQGGYSQEFIHNIDMSNTINGKPIIYLINQTNLTINSTTYPTIGYLAIMNSNNITVENLNISNNLQGILLVNTTNSSMKNVKLLNNFYGVELIYSNFNNITCSEIESNQEEQTALYLVRAKYNTITNNKITLNHKGIHLIDYSTNNTIVENAISNNWFGMHVQAYSSGNILYHNNFINNTEQVSNSWSNNTWDNDYPSGGNYWSDYTGEDQNGDGIGDTSYIIDTGNKDNYPLMNPFEPEIIDIAISNVTPATTIVKQGGSLSINITIENQGNTAETFNVTVYADQNPTVLQDEILIETRNVTLTGQNSTTLFFTWNTTGVAYGNYTISAYVTPVSGETDTDDNTYVDGTVLVTIPGDVNGDHTVDIFDIGYISAHWYPGPPIGPLGYDANADINSDGAVDIFDVGIASAHWGRSW